MLEPKVEVNDEFKLGLPKKLDTPPYISAFSAICFPSCSAVSAMCTVPAICFPSCQLSQPCVLSQPSAFPAVSCLSHVYCPSHLLFQLSVVSAICTIPVVCSQLCALSVVAVVAVELRPHVTYSVLSLILQCSVAKTVMWLVFTHTLISKKGTRLLGVQV